VKLLFVIDSLSTGGAQRQMVNLAIGLKRRNHLVEFFCYAPGDMLARPLGEAGITVHYHFKRSRFSLEVILALKELISLNNYDLVLAYLPTPNFYAIIAGRLLSPLRSPVVVSERRCDLPQGANLMERFARQFYRMANHVTTNSHQQRVDLVSNYPWMQKRLSTIHNGLDLDIFVPVTVEPDNAPLRLLIISGIAPHKNGLCLVKALHILGQRDGLYPRVDWIGKLPTGGEQLVHLEEINQAMRDHGLTEQWQWLGQRTDIVDQLHNHDVLVHPSYIEGLPNAVCEALACARPVIVSDIPEHSILVQHGKSGYLFDYDDPPDLADKIKMVALLSAADRKEMGQSGRKYAEDHLSLDRLVDEYECLFDEVLNGAPHARIGRQAR
jgi:GalNAc-alpha-(1->4)-GalNAc-alpha-(1->3)-diNAcBac-PP-undecaprenol alpha-1,4-N-acetyl-D-galactosaminyltransferase